MSTTCRRRPDRDARAGHHRLRERVAARRATTRGKIDNAGEATHRQAPAVRGVLAPQRSKESPIQRDARRHVDTAGRQRDSGHAEQVQEDDVGHEVDNHDDAADDREPRSCAAARRAPAMAMMPTIWKGICNAEKTWIFVTTSVS